VGEDGTAAVDITGGGGSPVAKGLVTYRVFSS
jgi:hypothetical protein